MAAGLAAELNESTGIAAELVEGGGGVFQVHLGGKLLYDKEETGRFPVLGEVSAIISERHPELAK